MGQSVRRLPLSLENSFLSELDTMMIHALDMETNFYGTIRLVMEHTHFDSTPSGISASQAERGLVRLSEDRLEAETYFFELLSPDFDDGAFSLWDKLANNQSELERLCQFLEREGVGWDPSPPEGVIARSMTWFYPNQSFLHNDKARELLCGGIQACLSLEAKTEFEQAQKTATLSTLVRHQCEHDWDGEPELWECSICGTQSFLDDFPENYRLA